MIPSFTNAEGVSPSLCLMPESPFGWELLKALPSLPARLTLLLPRGETSGLLSRSAWVAGLFPVCFLFLATIVPGKDRGLAAGELSKNEGVCELRSPTVAHIRSSDLPFYYLSDAFTGSSHQTRRNLMKLRPHLDV